MEFETLKKQMLKKRDKSIQGRVDEKIKPLIRIINSKQNYFTTSSCSGRIVLLETGEKKKDCKWLFCAHKRADCSEIKRIIDAYSEKRSVWLGFEGMILHIVCKTLKDADNLVRLSYENGFKRTGIISVKNFVVEISSSEKLIMPVIVNGKCVVSDLKVFVEESNKKMTENLKKINKLQESLNTIS